MRSREALEVASVEGFGVAIIAAWTWLLVFEAVSCESCFATRE